MPQMYDVIIDFHNKISEKKKGCRSSLSLLPIYGHKEKRPWYRLAEMDNTWLVFRQHHPDFSYSCSYFCFLCMISICKRPWPKTPYSKTELFYKTYILKLFFVAKKAVQSARPSCQINQPSRDNPLRLSKFNHVIENNFDYNYWTLFFQ